MGTKELIRDFDVANSNVFFLFMLADMFFFESQEYSDVIIACIHNKLFVTKNMKPLFEGVLCEVAHIY